MLLEIPLDARDALLLVDVQNDFLSGGALPVPQGNAILAPLAAWLERFHAHDLPIFASRDWHPPDHCSFTTRGGPWPIHCVAGTVGADFPPTLPLLATATVINKATGRDEEAYSAFQGTALDTLLRQAGVRRLFIGGLATDYCVLHTVEQALALGYSVFLLGDGIAAVDVHPGDGARAVARMCAAGAHLITAKLRP